MKRPLFLLVCLLLASPVQAKPLNSPETFAGVPLGMTLEDFRQLPYPEESRQTASAVCTGDPLPPGKETYFANLRPDGPLTGIGMTICRYYTPRYDGHREYWDEAGLTLAGAGTYPTAFLFTPLSSDAATSQRLFRIVMRPPANDFDKVHDALETQYGPAQWSRQEHVKNAVGTVLDDPAFTWDGDSSQMVLTKRVVRAELSRLALSDRQLLRHMQRVLHRHDWSPDQDE